MAANPPKSTTIAIDAVRILMALSSGSRDLGGRRGFAVVLDMMLRGRVAVEDRALGMAAGELCLIRRERVVVVGAIPGGLVVMPRRLLVRVSRGGVVLRTAETGRHRSDEVGWCDRTT